MTFSRASRSRLTPRTAPRFASETLFDRIARAVCAADCLPRKELYEAWEVARRVRRRFRGGRVVDLACGHALLGHIMLLLDDTSPEAVCVDPRRPLSAQRLAHQLAAVWPRIADRVHYVERPLAEVALHASDVVVSAHACGALTDQILERAVAARARVAVLPCCHDLADSSGSHFEGWMDGALALDVSRASRLLHAGYAIRTQTIPADVTPKNRLLLGTPLPAETG